MSKKFEEEIQDGYEETEDSQNGSQDNYDIMQRLSQAENSNSALLGAQPYATMAQKDGNVVMFQLDSTQLLEKLEHFYRGDKPGIDTAGNEVWVNPTDDESITLNDFGVASLMEIVAKYIDPNTKLTYMDEMRMNEMLGDLGDEMIMFIKCNKKKIGLDTPFKRTKFKLLIVTTLHVIENTMRRGLRGRTFEQINQTRIDVNTGPMMNYPGMQGMPGLPPKKTSFRWPWQ